MTLPDFETTVLDRLELCNTDILGAGHVWRLPPTYEKNPSIVPMVYAYPRAMREPILNRAGSAGQVVVVRDYLMAVFIAPVTPRDDINAGEGMKALKDAVPYFATFRDYYVSAHPDLSTATLPGLGLARALQYVDGGMDWTLVGPNGTVWVGFVITLTLALRGETDSSY